MKKLKDIAAKVLPPVKLIGGKALAGAKWLWAIPPVQSAAMTVALRVLGGSTVSAIAIGIVDAVLKS